MDARQRPVMDTRYFETFNRPNVRLVDLRRTGPLARITPSNLTGHYSLLLARPLDYNVAVRLLLVYQQEYASGTMKAGSTCFRNFEIGKEQIQLTDPFQFTMPLEGIMNVDFVSFLKAPHDAQRMSKTALRVLLYGLAFNKGALVASAIPERMLVPNSPTRGTKSTACVWGHNLSGGSATTCGE